MNENERIKFNPKGFYFEEELVFEFADIDDIEFEIKGQKYILQDFLVDLIIATLQNLDVTKQNFTRFKGIRNKKEDE
jgi:hypothetical protein